MTRNLQIISFDVADISKKNFDKQVGQLSSSDAFVPLADVPDEIWKKLPADRGGREGGRDTQGGVKRSDGPEHPNHYADIDAPFGPGGQTWRAQCLADDANIEPLAWRKFYKKIGDQAAAAGNTADATQYHSPLKQGLLPFRVWQFYGAMVGFARQGDVDSFVTAAGTMAHYVGDASQPLHGSVLADGDKSRTVTRHHPVANEDETVKYGDGVHSAYETDMLSAFADPLLKEIARQLDAAGSGHRLPLVTGGKAAARATLELMERAAATLPPMHILDAFEQAGASSQQKVLAAMYTTLGTATATVLAEGARTLAMLWESAWKEGGGDAVASGELQARDPAKIRSIYTDPGFIPSVTLDKIDTLLVR